jgi:hypothetical protein
MFEDTLKVAGYSGRCGPVLYDGCSRGYSEVCTRPYAVAVHATLMVAIEATLKVAVDDTRLRSSLP